MNLFIISDKINPKFFIKKESKFHWTKGQTIFLIAYRRHEMISSMTKILMENKIDKIIYFGYGHAINNDAPIGEICIVQKAYNTMVDLTKFGYKPGIYPGESEDAKTLKIENLNKVVETLPFLNVVKIGSSNINFNNKNYLDFILEKFNNEFNVLDRLSAAIFFVGNKFNIDNIYPFVFINSNKYDEHIFEGKDFLQFYKKINDLWKIEVN